MNTKPRIAIFDQLNQRERSFMRPLAAHLEANWQVDEKEAVEVSRARLRAGPPRA